MSSQRLPATASQVIAGSRSKYICQSCRNRLQKPPVHNSTQIRHSTGSPFLDKVRKKIWGTENPPGLANPYGPSWRERQRMQQQEQQRRKNLSPRQLAEEDALRAQELQRSTSNTSRLQQQPFEDDEPTEDDASPLRTGEYVPAENWQGLEHVGHKGHWKDVAPTKADAYYPWVAPKSELSWSRQELVQLLHRAVVENIPSSVRSQTVTSRYYSTRKPSSFIIRLGEDGSLKDVEEMKLIDEAAQVVSETAETPDGMRQVEGLDDNAHEARAEDGIVPSLNEDTSSEANNVDQTFLNAKLEFNSSQTFKILKKFQQMTSHRIRDPVIHSFAQHPQPFQGLIEHVLDLQKPRPKNMYERLMEKKSLQVHSNLMILPRRETPVDKEKEVGRWKVIEKELKDRGLPVLGSSETPR